MNELLLEKCTKFVDDKNELSRNIFSLEQENVAIAYIYILTLKKISTMRLSKFANELLVSHSHLHRLIVFTCQKYMLR